MELSVDAASAESLPLANEFFEDLEIPAALEDSLRRHREHLAALVRNLRSAGIREEQIEASISAMLASYKQELLSAIRVMKG